MSSFSSVDAAYIDLFRMWDNFVLKWFFLRIGYTCIKFLFVIIRVVYA
jgi:hypothetical protein